MKRLFVALILCMLLIAHSWANPRLRKHQLMLKNSDADIKVEITFGKEIAARIIGKYSLYENTSLTRYINLVGKSLIKNTNRSNLNYTFGVLNTDSINAFSAPGGFVFVTKGAIDTMENEAQLASVLAHEIIHVIQKHVINDLDINNYDSSTMSSLTQFMSGPFDTAKIAFSQAVDKAMNILFEQGYKTNDEMEADNKGVVLMALTGYDPVEMLKYFNKIKCEKNGKISAMTKLYPPFEKRITSIKSTMYKYGLINNNLLKGKERFNAYLEKQE